MTGPLALPEDDSPQTLARLFSEPPREYGPTPLWWWSGGEVTPERLEWQMRRFAEGGIYNLVLINLAPAGPTFGALPDEPAWFSERWWQHFSHACDVAAELDMNLWLYDQIGFSGANIQGRITATDPTAQGRRLHHHLGSAGTDDVRVPMGEELVAAYVDGVRVEASPDGRVDAPDGSRVELVTASVSAFDYLSPAACARLIDHVHGEYERRVPQHLGSVIVGSFQDELPATNSWSESFAEEFRARMGYDLLDHALALFRASPCFAGEAAAKVRGDYYAVRTELTEKAFFAPLAQWHDRHQMLLGADQTNPARAGYPNQGTQLYTDYFRTHRWFSAVGSDHEGDAKVHSSMAHLYEHPRVWVEAFHSSGWGGTLEETYDWLLPFIRSGGNLYNPHASYFSTEAGWFEWAPPSTDWRQPYWRHYRGFADAVARLCATMSWGTYDADVAVLHPTATAQAEIGVDQPVAYFHDHNVGSIDADRAQEIYLELCGSNNWFETKSSALDDAGIAFDVIDDASIQRGEIKQTRLAVARQSYRTVILPNAACMEAETARRLVELLDDGGRVIAVGDCGRLAAGRDGDEQAIAALVGHRGLISVESVAEAMSRLDPAEQHVSASGPLLVRRSQDTGIALVTAAHPSATHHPPRAAGEQWADYQFDRSRYATTRTLTVRAENVTAESWNPATGERRELSVDQNDGHSTVTVPLEGAPAVLVVWREHTEQPTQVASPDPTTPAAAAPTEAESGQVVDGTWEGELLPTMDNTWGDLGRPAGPAQHDLELWHLEALNPQGEWAPTRATFGETVLISSGPTTPLDQSECSEVLAGTRQLSDGGSWQPYSYSASRGAARDPIGQLGSKGMVPSEFVLCDRPNPGSSVMVRALVRTDHRGAADLLVLAGVAKRAWWNGAEVAGEVGYLLRGRVEVDRSVNVLEYELRPESEVTSALAHVVSEEDTEVATVLGSGFALATPGSFTDRPEYMTAPLELFVAPAATISGAGTVTFGRSFRLDDDAAHARLNVGGVRAITVRLDGEVVGRQEKVTHYDVGPLTAPQFFTYDVSARLQAGEHRLEVSLDAGDPSDLLFVDLAVTTGAGTEFVPSGTGWEVEVGDRRGMSTVSARHWHPLESAYAVERPHPLPDTSWLRGEPAAGEPSLRLEVTDHVEEHKRAVRVSLPAGTRSARIPATVRVTAAIAGVEVPVEQGVITLDSPLAEPSELEIWTEPLAFGSGASFLNGPILVQTQPAPIRLGEWREIGLADFSGAVVYRTRVTPPRGRRWSLDLGDLRGSLDLRVDGRYVGSAFCGPFRFDLDPVEGEVELEVTVTNTLGPYLHASTPTTWVFGSQLSSGLFGPVVIT